MSIERKRRRKEFGKNSAALVRTHSNRYSCSEDLAKCKFFRHETSQNVATSSSETKFGK